MFADADDFVIHINEMPTVAPEDITVTLVSGISG